MSTIAVRPESTVHAGFRAPAKPDDAFGIYVHVPFCWHICPYCDFNTYAGQASRIPRYVAAVAREIALWAPAFAGRPVASIFLGGGTPSLLTPTQISTILAACRDWMDVASDAEITIESNPNDVTEDYVAGLLEAGVRRLSIGAQTLDRRGLRTLGRMHEASQVASAVAAARSAGMANLSLDFIYGWPGQSIDQWRNDLERVLAGDVGGSPPEHVSLYGLIVESGTPMADAVARGILTPADDDTSAEFSDLADAILEEAGWQHYEIANWSAAPEFASRHNALYWRNGDYAGIGAGAHGHVSEQRTMNQPSIERYIADLEAGRSPVTNVESIAPRLAMAETMMLGLRLLHDGVSADAFSERHGLSLHQAFGPQISRLEEIGLIRNEGGSVRLTRRGASVANSVCTEFMPD